MRVLIKCLVSSILMLFIASPASALPIYHAPATGITSAGVAGYPVYIFDSTGTNIIGQYDPISSSGPFPVDYRDGASDGTYVYFGWEGGVARHSADGSGGTLLFDDTTFPSFIFAPVGLAYDPTGDGGNGSLWMVQFGSSIYEYDLSGTLLTTFPNVGWSLYGLAYNDANGNLFGHMSSTGDIVEINTSTGTVTPLWGTAFSGLLSGGGLSGYSELGGNLAIVSQEDTQDKAGIINGSGSLIQGPWPWSTLTGSTYHRGVAVLDLDPIPEPSTMILLGFGLLGLAGVARKKMKK